MASSFSLLGGVALGLASSLHCIGMCGGISLMFGYAGGCTTPAADMRAQALLHGGRILSYALLGALAGAAGGLAAGQVDAAAGHHLLRWAAAVSLGWMGLVTAGMAPAPALLGHGFAPRRLMARALLHMPVPARRFAGGLAWGLLPCGMVYGALLFALFAGSAAGGALVMLGFGLGTLPALIAAGLGFGRLQSALRAHRGERWLGAAMIALAALSLLASEASFGTWCRTLARPFSA
ncbi:hypothetical membrane protein [Sphingobium sp. SYK-6]|uniref:sulfite exporter TauE/SafE family protein n=1 Tax=Sphingobium sp. (strain NBRC 103272 / SYK-6) TaxID=627192 RepID=UPI0002277FD4|nr:sulfite exporter TauE/SafE family protein [Sphingobium sp. SYK-6]BAK68505.1 hypothetical membrane protein [Sphingobium sp. SYK-6]